MYMLSIDLCTPRYDYSAAGICLQHSNLTAVLPFYLFLIAVVFPGANTARKVFP